jgi:hypothetical protein
MFPGDVLFFGMFSPAISYGASFQGNIPSSPLLFNDFSTHPHH